MPEREKTVLIVEDNEDNRIVYAAMLRHVGYAVAESVWQLMLLSAMFGALVHRTDFCTMGSVADIVGYGDWTRMRQWAMAICCAQPRYTTLFTWPLSSMSAGAGRKSLSKTRLPCGGASSRFARRSRTCTRL